MAARRILVESSLIIDFFRKSNKEKAPLYHLFQLNEDLFISTLTVYELLCGAKSDQLLIDTENILKLFDILEFDFASASKAAFLFKQLRRQNKLIETIDILIAATALTHELEIATLNIGHFNRFPELKLVES